MVKALDYDAILGGNKYIIMDSRVFMRSKPLVKEQDRRNHWHCPDCEFVMGMEAKIYNYCPKCGLPIRMEAE